MTIMNAVAGAILVAFGLFLISLAVVVFAKPAVAERFFMSFASSARAHYTEQVVRLLIGASLVIRSAAMWEPKFFWLVGCAIVLSSLVLILAPWQWHHRFGEKVRPILIRRMKLFAIGIFAFGVLLLYGVFSAVSPNAFYTLVGEKSRLHSSYEKGCQGKNLQLRRFLAACGPRLFTACDCSRARTPALPGRGAAGRRQSALLPPSPAAPLPPT